MNDLLTLAEVRAHLKVGRWVVDGAIASGTLKVVRLGERTIRVRPADLATYETRATRTEPTRSQRSPGQTTRSPSSGMKTCEERGGSTKGGTCARSVATKRPELAVKP